MTSLSVFVITLNNAATLERCLASVQFADEIVVLDSGSTDATEQIAREAGARFAYRSFDGFGPQKQAALELTSHDWVLLLDADEALSFAAQRKIQSLLASGPRAAGYALPRVEQMFWRMQSTASRLNYFLRLFDKRRGSLSEMPVHAAPEVRGEVVKLHGAWLHHYGEPSIHVKVDKINSYSSGLVEDPAKQQALAPQLRMLIYPPFAFFRSYLLKRQFVNGWAGFIASVTMAFYAFLKYAKVYERRREERDR